MTATVTRPSRPAARPPEPGPVRAGFNAVRRVWRRLTSMRTALVLLFLLAVAAVPGSLLPQRPLNPSKVDSYLASHGAWGRFLDRLGFFDVFGTPWFAAIYLLLAISLIGCLIPRIRIHARAARSKPLPAPRNLDRLPESARFVVEGGPEATSAAMRQALGRRWRTVRRADERSPGGQVLSAEKGYLRETGNLVFHVALLVSLIAIAAGRLWGYSASVVVVQGRGFCNTVIAYDSWRPGRFEQDGNVAPFCIDSVDKFDATYLASGEPSKFSADVTYSRGTNGTPEKAKIEVNHPLRLEGDRVYLIGHGYAPVVTVTMPDGKVLKNIPAAYIPQDPNTFFSEGAFMFQGAPEADGSHKNDIGINGFFAPDAALAANGVYTSVGPQDTNPVLGITIYQGDLGFNGQPKSVYSLDQNQIDSGKLKKIGMVNLKPGQTSPTLANGVKVTFDGDLPWVSMQVSHDPTQGYLLISASAMVVGLIGSLAVRRRRVWVRMTPADPDPHAVDPSAARTVVEVGGLARSDSGNFTEEFSSLVARLKAAGNRPGGPI